MLLHVGAPWTCFRYCYLLLVLFGFVNFALTTESLILLEIKSIQGNAQNLIKLYSFSLSSHPSDLFSLYPSALPPPFSSRISLSFCLFTAMHISAFSSYKYLALRTLVICFKRTCIEGTIYENPYALEVTGMGLFEKK